MEEKLISLLALERCEVYVAQVYALMHGSDEDNSSKGHKHNADNIMHLMQNISRDISLIKDRIE